MKIENERYYILSKGKEQPERVPDDNSVVDLYVNNKDTTLKEIKDKIARLEVEYVDLLGKTRTDARSIYVFGKVTLNDESLPSVARYSVNSVKESGEVIGELVAKRMIDNL